MEKPVEDTEEGTEPSLGHGVGDRKTEIRRATQKKVRPAYRSGKDLATSVASDPNEGNTREFSLP